MWDEKSLLRKLDRNGKIENDMPIYIRKWISKNSDFTFDEGDRMKEAKKAFSANGSKNIMRYLKSKLYDEKFENQLDAEPCKIPFDMYEMDLKKLTIEKRTNLHLWSKTLSHKLRFHGVNDEEEEEESKDQNQMQKWQNKKNYTEY